MHHASLVLVLEVAGCRRAEHIICVIRLPDYQLVLLPLKETGGEVPQVPVLVVVAADGDRRAPVAVRA